MRGAGQKDCGLACPAKARRCGGCPLLELPYEEQLRQKQQFVERLLGRFAPVEPILGMEGPLHYRNKVISPYAPGRRLAGGEGRGRDSGRDTQKGRGRATGKGRERGRGHRDAPRREILCGMYAAGSHRIVPTDGCLIENKEAIATMTSMLETVVTDGTGKAAAIEGFDVAGKTSTAEIYDEENGGYRKGVYNLAFTGFLADSSSQLVCFVAANEVPTDGVVTPMFKDIMTAAIDRFDIYPE